MTAVRKITDLGIRLYGDTVGGQTVICEPSLKDVRDAIQSGCLEKRNYQTDLEELKTEWIEACQKSSNPHDAWQRIVRRYHARRIAHFVVNGWKQPIVINAKNEVIDGTHRIKAAIFQGALEVEVVIQ